MNPGHLIKEFRKSRKVTQRQLAAFLGVTPSYISHIESGSRNVPAEILARIARHLNVRMSLLVNEQAPPTRFGHAVRAVTDDLKPAIDLCSRLHSNLWELENMVCGRPGLGALSRLGDMPTVPRKAALEVRGLLGLSTTHATSLDDLCRALVLQSVVVFQVPLPGPAAGLASRDAPSAVFLNATLSPERRLLTLAQQLGHLALHQYGLALAEPPRRRLSEEDEAREFALEFLMPADLIQRLTWILPETMDRATAGRAMARFLGLEPSVVFARLDELGRLPRSALPESRPPEAAGRGSPAEVPFDPLTHLPDRYLMLARIAFERREVNAIRLAELLMVPTDRAIQAFESLLARENGTAVP